MATLKGTTTATPNIDVPSLIEQLKLLVDHPEIVTADENHCGEVQRLARLASVALETPTQSMQRMMFAYVPLITTYISNDLNIFAKLSQGDDTHTVSLAALSEASALDKSLVRAIMDFHVYQGAALEPKQGFYVPTRLTHSLLDPKVVKTTNCWHEVVGPAFTKLHSVLKQGDADLYNQKTAFQTAHGTTDTFYNFLESNRDKHKLFYDYMAANHSTTEKWLDVVRFDEEFAQGVKGKNEVVFVDVGGGDGGQSVQVTKAHKLGGRIIMQDRPAVVAKADEAREAGVETMDYDFFTEQPIKGARVYFIQFVLLNWQDAECVKILASQAPAMTAESTLLIVDFVQAHRWESSGEPREADLWTPATALAARACHHAKGRARADYADLLKQAGLRLTEIRIFTGQGQGIIMAKKA